MHLEEEINYFIHNVYFAIYFDSQDGGTTACSNSKQQFILLGFIHTNWCIFSYNYVSVF